MKKTNFLNSFGGSRSPLLPLGCLVRLFLPIPASAHEQQLEKVTLSKGLWKQVQKSFQSSPSCSGSAQLGMEQKEQGRPDPAP